MHKERLDVLLVQKGICTSREMAKRLIMAGKIKVENEIIIKAGTKVDSLSTITNFQSKMPFVSRGGLKLQRAVDVFDVQLENKVCFDIGSSTGGFTDCMLQHGAKHVYAFDVGYGQLDWKLRSDNRVSVYEKTNFRYIEKDMISDFLFPQFASIDVSFISLKLIIPALLRLSSDNLEIVALIKPQFEAGKDKVGKKGIIKDPKVHIDVINMIIKAITEMELYTKGLTYSPVKGAKGNIEYLIYLTKNKIDETKINVDELVSLAHEGL